MVLAMIFDSIVQETLSAMIFDNIVQEYVFFLNLMMDRTGTEAVAPREGASGHQMWPHRPRGRIH